MMTLSRLETLIARHGSDLSLWPAEDAAAAQRLLQQDAAAATLLRDSQQLDALVAEALAAEAELTVDDSLVAQIAARAYRTEQVTPRPRACGLMQAIRQAFHLSRRQIWASGASLASLAALTFCAGLWISTPMQASAEDEALIVAELAETAFGHGDTLLGLDGLSFDEGGL